MRLKELNDLVCDDEGYLFFVVDDVKYEISELVDDSSEEIILSGFAS